eukprot:gb/GECG01007969.1/.p1 GENE.gb/GECG01007969.1/~~gb/GECG01007969.1/.p1  ORF type:complete len:1420 (+),score=199.51 gb/GECG01007969.1/:1-4260(+)
MPLVSPTFSQTAAAAARANPSIFALGDTPQHVPCSDDSGVMDKNDHHSAIDGNFSYSATSVDENQGLSDISLGPIEFETQEIPDVDNYDSELQTLLSLSNELADIVRRGQRYVDKLYSYRGCTMSIPQVPHGEESRSHELHTKVFQTLRPRVEILYEVTDFKDEVKQMISYAVEELASDKYTVIPSHIGRLLTLLFDIALKIDTLKDVKSGVKNEMSQFKRSFTVVRSDVEDAELIDARNQNTQQFLNTPGVFLHELNQELKESTGYKMVLKTLLRNVLGRIQEGNYTSPSEKHHNIRSLGILFVLVDEIPEHTDRQRKGSVFTDREIELSEIYKVFKTYPIVPLVWDIPLQMRLLITSAKSGTDADYEAALGSDSQQQEAKSNLSVAKHWQTMREQHQALMVRLTNVIARVKRENIFGNTLGADLPGEPPSIVKETWNVVVEALQLLSSWSSLLLEENAIKHVSLSPNKDPKSPYLEYERAIRYNYTHEEKIILVDMVGMIKSTASSLTNARNELDPVLRLHCFTSIQWFAHGLTTDQMTKALRQGDKEIYPAIKRVRTIAAEWSEAFHGDSSAQENQHMNDARYKKKGSTIKKTPTNLPSGRVVGLHPAQNYSLRTAIELLVDPGSKYMEGGTGLLSRKKPMMREGKIEMFREFNRELAHFAPVLELCGAVREATNLGALWFREAYVERCQVVQFPVECSLPWILLDTCVDGGNNSFIWNVFYIFDVYNDATQVSLYEFRKQHLFDEIEAEVNLAFDQFSYLLSESVFENAKKAAAVDMFSPESKKHWGQYASLLRKHDMPLNIKASTRGKTDSPSSGHKLDFTKFLKVVLSQPNVNILGRNIDFSFILTHHINKLVRQDIETALETFEEDVLAGVIDYDIILQIVRKCHGELSEFLQLDEFSVVLEEVESFLSPYSGLSRSLLHVIEEIGIDLLPYFSYSTVNRRFTRTGGANIQNEIASNETMLEAVAIEESKAHYRKGNKMKSRRFQIFGANEAMALGSSTLYLRNFIGIQHVAAISRVCGAQGVARLVNELIVYIKELLNNDFEAYFGVLLDGLPPTSFPRYDLGSSGAYVVYEAKLKPMLEYVDLKPCVFHMMRKIGNAVAFAQLLDGVLARHDLQQFFHLSPFIFPPEHAKGGSSSSENEKRYQQTPLQRMTETSVQLSVETGASNTLKYPQDNFLTEMAVHSQNVYSSTKYPVPILAHVLHSLAHMLYEEKAEGDQEPLANRWASHVGSATNESLVNFVAGGNSAEFHRLWSTILFVFCMPSTVSGVEESGTKKSESVPGLDYPEFGDGFLWAGALLLRLMNQWSRFRLYDWTSHLLDISDYESDELSTGASASHSADEEYKRAATLFKRTAEKALPVLEQAYVMMGAKLPSPLPDMSVDLHNSALRDFEFDPPEEDTPGDRVEEKFVVK